MFFVFFELRLIDMIRIKEIRILNVCVVMVHCTGYHLADASTRIVIYLVLNNYPEGPEGLLLHYYSTDLLIRYIPIILIKYYIKCIWWTAKGHPFVALNKYEMDCS